MRFRRAAPAVLVVAVIVVVTGMTFVANRLFSGLTHEVEAGQFALMRSSIEFSLQSAEKDATERAELVAEMPGVRAAFAARDRPRLLAETAEMFRIQHERYGVDQMQFHLAPATSFLRLHDPATFGDDLRRIRPMIVRANQAQTPQQGIGMTRSGPAFLGVVPVRDLQQQATGSFEVAIEVGDALDSMKAAYGLELALFIDERPLREVAATLQGDALSEHNRVGRYMKFHSTHWALLQRLVSSANLAAAGEPVHYVQEALGRPYGVLLLPLRSPEGQPLGVLAAARDFTGTRAAARRSLVWQLLLAVCAMAVLSGFVLVVLRGFMVRPLGLLVRRFTALADGDRSQPAEPLEGHSEELAALSRAYEKLRASSAESEPRA